MSKEELKRFYEGKEKRPNLYGYDEEGNLIEKNRQGEIIKTIPLPVYRFPTFEEYDTMEKHRTEEIAKASKEFNDARKRLRELIVDPDSMKSQIFLQNNKVVEADIRLQKVRFPLRYVEMYPEKSIEIRKLDFNQPNEKRKYPYSIAMLETGPFPLQEQYVRTGVSPKKPLISVQQAKEQAMKGESVILFSEPDTNDYGFMSLSWVVDLDYNGTVYQSAKQAIYAEIAKSFQDQANLQILMSAENPDAIVYSVKDVPGDPDANEPKWNEQLNRLIYDINLIKFKQYPELAQRLLETQQANLGAYLPNDNQLGIGISLDNIQSKNPVHWTGSNLLGKALMDIRQQLRSEQEAVMQQQVAAPKKPQGYKIKIKSKSATLPVVESVAAPVLPIAPSQNIIVAEEVLNPPAPSEVETEAETKAVDASAAAAPSIQRRIPRIAKQSIRVEP